MQAEQSFIEAYTGHLCLNKSEQKQNQTAIVNRNVTLNLCKHGLIN